MSRTSDQLEHKKSSKTQFSFSFGKWRDKESDKETD